MHITGVSVCVVNDGVPSAGMAKGPSWAWKAVAEPGFGLGACWTNVLTCNSEKSIKQLGKQS